MLVRAVLVAALTATTASAGHANTQSPANELSFSLRLRGVYVRTAVCVGQPGDLGHGRRMTRLALQYGGAWSPDGRSLALADGDPPNGGIHVVAADGSGRRAATRPRPNELDSAPTWSPDGTRLAFARYVFFSRRAPADYRRAGVWVAASAGGDEQQISGRFAGTLDWSPTGDLIAADVGGEFKTDIDLLRPSGGVERTIRVGDDASFDDGVSWSPDGTRLALGGGLIVDRDGNEVGRYAPMPGGAIAVRLPAWSRDGASVAYVRAPSFQNPRTNVRILGESDLYLGPATGGPPVRLTATSGISEDAPAWRPTTATAAGRAQPCLVRGTPGRDVFRGTPLDDLVDAGAGNDVVYGTGGNDFVAGGSGADVLAGGPGRDVLWGEAGNDRFSARDRNRDSILGGFGRDRASVDRRLDSVLGVERVSAR